MFGGFASFKSDASALPGTGTSSDNFSALDLLNSLVMERQELTNSLQVFDLDEQRVYSLITRGQAPSPREDFGMQRFGNRLFVFGGYKEGKAAGDLHMLDLDSLRWSLIEGPREIRGRQGVQLIYMDKKLFVVGGVDKPNGRTVNDGWVYDLAQQRFEKIPFEEEVFLGTGPVVLYRNDLYLMNRCDVEGDCHFDLAVLEMGVDCPSGCSGRGLCNSAGICNCSLGFEGNDCQNTNACESDCKSHAFCHSHGQCDRDCVSGRCGQRPAQAVKCPGDCGGLARGICLDNGKCLCNPGLGGEDCSVDVEDREAERVFGVDDEVLRSIKAERGAGADGAETETGTDLPENYRKLTFEMFGFKYFRQRSAMGKQRDLQKYDSLQNCPDECNSRWADQGLLQGRRVLLPPGVRR